MLEVYNKDRRLVAILENALNIIEHESLNSVNTLKFALPLGDSKNIHCQAYNYVRSLKGQLYRIMPSSVTADETGNIAYECEHVIATLIDNVMFGYHVVGNRGYYTREVIEYILSKQKIKHWVLGRCSFKREFEYGWEQESLLSALWSVPKPLAEEFIFRFDTSGYPWVLHLDKLTMDINPEVYIRAKHNMLRLTKKSDPKQICTRLYPLGYGEGVNQLTIKDVNNGCLYIESPPEVIAKYGIIERVWIDRRYEDANSLMGAALTMLKELENPYVQYETDFTQVSENNHDKVELGKVCRVIDNNVGIDFKTYIKEITTNFEEIEKSTLQIANKSQDIAGTIADMADRQRIEMAYSQGATQLYEKSVIDNASPQEGVNMNFVIPLDMRIVNKVLAKISLSSFRAYSKATTNSDRQYYSSSSGGGTWVTSSSGGGTETSTTSGGGEWSSTESGGGSYETTEVDDYIEYRNGHNHGIDRGTKLAVYGGLVKVGDDEYVVGRNGAKPYVMWAPSGNHTHTVEIPKHRHDFYIPNHSHNVKIRSHVHDTKIPSHNHTVEIAGHGHEITPTISYFGNPKSFKIYIGDKLVGQYNNVDVEIDITKLLLDSKNKIPRGQWLQLKVVPDDLAHVQIDLHVQGFVQSRGDNTV